MRGLLCRGVLVLGVVTANSAFGSLVNYRDNYRDVRMLGAGNAGVASVDTGSSAFYNPAGLGLAPGYNFKFLDLFMGGNQNFKDSFAQGLHLSGGASTLSEKFSPFLGKPLALQGGFFPYIASPGFLIGFFDSLDMSINYRDPVYPRLIVNGRNDYGLVFGGAYSIQDRLYFGGTLRYQRRREIDEDITAGALVSQSSTLLRSVQKFGDGYGFNLGVQYRQPISSVHWAAIGAALIDAGQTRFKNANRTPPPSGQGQQVNVGAAYGFKTLAIDGRLMLDLVRLKEPNLSYTKRINMGMEISVFMMDIRGGLYQGYWTAGLTLRVFPLLNIDFTSYAEELGVSAGQAQNRFYLMGVTLGMELKTTTTGKRQRYTIDNL